MLPWRLRKLKIPLIFAFDNAMVSHQGHESRQKSLLTALLTERMLYNLLLPKQSITLPPLFFFLFLFVSFFLLGVI